MLKSGDWGYSVGFSRFLGRATRDIIITGHFKMVYMGKDVSMCCERVLIEVVSGKSAVPISEDQSLF